MGEDERPQMGEDERPQMGEDERPPWTRPPDLSSDAALDRLLRRLGPLLRWQEHEETSAPEEEHARPDPAFARRLRARLTEETEEEGATPPRDRRGTDRRVALRVGLAVATLAVVILVAVAVVEVGVVAALTTALALVVLAAVLVVRARLGQ